MAANDFPYYVTKGIDHYLLWSSQERKWNVYEDYIARKFPNNKYEILMFENAKENKSVKSVVHIHVFIRLRETL